MISSLSSRFFIHHLHQLLGFVLEKVSIFQILVKFLLFLHLGRAMFYASYFYNPNTWFSGILLGIFLMAIAFMGYVLPFHFLFLYLYYCWAYLCFSFLVQRFIKRIR
eukprot:UN0406